MNNLCEECLILCESRIDLYCPLNTVLLWCLSTWIHESTACYNFHADRIEDTTSNN
jgi:hypothetical protein